MRTPGTPSYEGLVGALAETFKANGAGSVDATHQAHGLISMIIDRQATTIAYVEVISILAVIILCLVPFLLIMRRPRVTTAEQTAVH